MRQALDLAIDRDVLNQVIGEGMFQPAHQPFPPASFAFNKAVEHTGRDPKKAQALLKEAGLDRVGSRSPSATTPPCSRCSS